MNRIQLEEFSTEELVSIKRLVDCILKDREGDQPGVKLILPAGCDRITLIKMVREASGFGLREAKDAVDAQAVIPYRDTDSYRRLVEFVKTG